MSIQESLAHALAEDPIPVLGIVVGCTTGVLIVVGSALANAWRRVRITEAEMALKQDMLERGMSAEEIERVMKASGAGSKRERSC